MNYKNITFLALSAFAFLLTGCATIMNGPNQKVGVISTPSDADVWVDHQYVGRSPIVLQLTRNQNHLIHVELAGFEPQDIVLSRKVSGWVFGNIIIPGTIIGVAIDAYTGSIYRLTPDQVHANLENQQCIYTKRGDISSVSIVLKADPSWEQIGQLTPS
jgi:PEGA domain.